jgi:hypothetical protein
LCFHHSAHQKRLIDDLRQPDISDVKFPMFIQKDIFGFSVKINNSANACQRHSEKVAGIGARIEKVEMGRLLNDSVKMFQMVQ